jgi:hypothetical protein
MIQRIIIVYLNIQYVGTIFFFAALLGICLQKEINEKDDN